MIYLCQQEYVNIYIGRLFYSSEEQSVLGDDDKNDACRKILGGKSDNTALPSPSNIQLQLIN